jgi:hypothetical protein
LHRAKEWLTHDHGWSDKAALKHLRPLDELSRDREQLWQRKVHGLAVLVSLDLVEWFMLPKAITREEVIIGHGFSLDELIKQTQRQAFYLLSVSPKRVSLFRGDGQEMKEISLPDLPGTDFKAYFRIDEYPRSLQFSSATSQRLQGDNKGGQQYHGQYEPNEENKKLLKRYFRRVNQAVASHVRPSRLPLIFAGVKHLFPLYKSVNTYQGLLDECIAGNHDRAKLHELQQKAVGLVS